MTRDPQADMVVQIVESGSLEAELSIQLLQSQLNGGGASAYLEAAQNLAELEDPYAAQDNLRIFAQSTEPSTPATGDIWIDTSGS